MATLTTSWQNIASWGYTFPPGNTVTFYLDAKYSSQSIANNNTDIQTRLTSGMSGGSASGAGYTYACSYAPTVSGSGVWNFETETITSGSATITHNSDGTKSLTLNANVVNNNWGFNHTLSANVSLPTIPRQANIISAPDFNDEGNPTITYSNPAGNSVTALEAYIEKDASTLLVPLRSVSKTGSSYTFNLTTEERNTLRQACTGKTMPVRFCLQTTIGSSKYWSVNTKTMSIINGEPTLSYDVVETDEDVIEIVGTNELLIKNVTKPKVTLTGTPKKYATISKYTMELNGNYAEGNEYTFNKLTGNSLKMSVTDSRGFTTQETETLDIIDYFNPSATIYVPRAEENDDNAYINIDGTWYNEGFGNVDNELTISWQYREAEVETWTYGGTITPTITNNTFKVEDYLLGNNFSYAKEYKIKVTISDLFNTRDYTTTRQKNDYSLKDTYYESDIFTYEDANSIEDYIYQTYMLLNKQMGTSYSYTKQLWYKNSALLVPKLNHIEEGIKLLGQYYYRPEGWQKTKIWNATKPEKFDYTDVNRWINNLNLITERLYNESNSLFPSDTLYPSETLLPH